VPITSFGGLEIAFDEGVLEPRPWTIEQMRSYVLETIELFGTDRAMFASDFPTDKLFGGFDQHLDAYNAIVADFSDDERRALFAGNANRLYRLGLPL